MSGEATLVPPQPVSAYWLPVGKCGDVRIGPAGGERVHDALLVGGSLPDRAEPAAGAEPVVDPLSVPQCPRVVAPPGLPDAVSVGIDVESRTADGGHPRVAGGIVMVDVAYADRFVASVAGGEEERLSLGCALLEELLIGADRIDGVTRQEVPPGVVDH